MNKTATLGKTLTPKKTLPPRKVPSLEEVFFGDEAPVLSVELEDEALYTKTASSGDEGSTLEKALTFEQILSEDTSSGENTQVHPFPEASPSNSKGKSSSYHKPEEQPLDGRDSSALQLEATAGPLEDLVQPWEEPTTLQETTPGKNEKTPKKEGASKKVAVAHKGPHPVKPTPGPQGAPTLRSQNPTVGKNDKEEVMKLQEEVESLRKALELMGEQLE